MFFRKQKQEEKLEPKGIALFSTYTSSMGLGTSFFHPNHKEEGGPGFSALDFHPFYKIDDKIEDNVKVNGVWFKNSEIFLFEDKTSDELVLYKRKMEEQYILREWTDIHQLYNDGLSVSYDMFSAQNHFYNKKLERKIDKKINEIIGGKLLI